MIFSAVLLPFIAVASNAATPCTAAVGKRMEPCLPSAAERAEIVGLIKKADSDFDEFAQAKEREAHFRGHLDLGDSASLEQWARSRDEMERYSATAQDAFTKAAEKAALYYGVAPKAGKGYVTGGALRGATAEWNPRLQGQEDKVFAVVRGGRRHFLKYSDREPREPRDPRDPKSAKAVDSASLDDGTVAVSIRLLRRVLTANDGHGDPAVFAAQLVFERSRFEARTCFYGRIRCGGGAWRDVGAQTVERNALNAVIAVGDQIGLSSDTVEDLKSRRAELADQLSDTTSVRPRAFLTPEQSEANGMDWTVAQERLRHVKRQQRRLEQRLAAQRRGDPPPRDLRDSLNDDGPEGAAGADGGCPETGFWAGEVYVPTPCAGALPLPPSGTEAIPATLPSPAVPAVPAPPVRAIPSLYELAERICASPAAAHSQPQHDDFRTGWYASAVDDSVFPRCKREVFIAFKKLRQEGYSDYNSAYFQALAENMNMPQPPAFEPPVPEVDVPVPAGPGVRDCMRAEGRRCIRWR